MDTGGTTVPLFHRFLRAAEIVYGAPLLVLYRLNRNRDTITADISRWFEMLHVDLGWRKGTAFLLGHYPEFRSLFYYRLGWHWKPVVWIVRIFYPPCPALYFYCAEIGPGLFIQHGFSTIVGAKRIGKNCWINQQVTIGHVQQSCPTIGDNVVIHAGALILGDIVMGDNATVGAGSVVLNDVPAGCTVFGVPARIIRRRQDS